MCIVFLSLYHVYISKFTLNQLSTTLPKVIYNLMMLFQPELGLSVLDLLGRSADSVRWTPLLKQETKRISGGSPVASPMPKSNLSGGREDQLLRE